MLSDRDMTTILKENFILLFTISTETRKQSSTIENFDPTIATLEIVHQILLN